MSFSKTDMSARQVSSAPSLPLTFTEHKPVPAQAAHESRYLDLFHRAYIVNQEVELRLNSLGLATTPRGVVVYLQDRETEVSNEELGQHIRLLREGYLPGPSAENGRLQSLIPGELQFWSTEGLVRGPTTPTAGPTVLASASIVGPSTPRTSRGVYVELGSYFTSEGLRNSVVHTTRPRRRAMGAGQRLVDHPDHPVARPSNGTAAPRGSVFYAGGPVSTGPSTFVPRASAPAFVPHGTISAPTVMPSAAASTGQLAILMQVAAPAVSTPTPVVNLPPPPVVVTAAPPSMPANGPGVGVDIDNPDLRIVVLSGIPKCTTLRDLSESVSSGLYGALYSLRFRMEGSERVAQVIFRDAFMVDTHRTATPGAGGYYTAMMKAEKQPWEDRNEALWPFPRECVINIRLEEFPENDAIRGMRPPRGTTTPDPTATLSQVPALSRRISLVGRGKLFRTFRERDIMGVILGGGTVLEARVERVCVYNSGNATVVFADVETAVQAIKCLEAHNRRSPSVKRLGVSHSKCPCEISVHCCTWTAMPASTIVRNGPAVLRSSIFQRAHIDVSEDAAGVAVFDDTQQLFRAAVRGQQLLATCVLGSALCA
ncbi:hypothetical protein V493_05342 [Pseudogymnoascus sp. VKM F-4281 (FW-2241)]|nr:hypothetical protein V493_05342 [Pseudogymnoascus sp. VKM F-4281 (FW-2241)]